MDMSKILMFGKELTLYHTMPCFNSLPNAKILGQSNLEDFAVDVINVT